MRDTSLRCGVFRCMFHIMTKPLKSLPSCPDTDGYAVIYIRVSTARQLQGASLETQQRACLEFCEKNGWCVLRIFREEGESAKTADRTELQEMLRFCRSGNPRPEYVVVFALDRFARNGVDHDTLRADLLTLRIKLRCVQTPLGESPYEKAVERILSALPQLDNELRAERSVAGMKTRLEGGRWTFKAPLGYTNGRDAQNNKTLLHDPDRAPLVKTAFELYATGLHTKVQVCNRVNAEGLRSLKGKPLGAETFNRMLRNPRYAGILEVDQWGIAVDGNFTPIVGKDVFDRVQEVLEGRRYAITPRKRNRQEFPLRGFVRCAECHKPLTGSPSTGKMGVKYLYYHCQQKSCPSPVNVRVEVLHDGFLNFMRQQQPDSEYLRLFHKVVTDVWNNKQADAVDLARKLEGRLDDLKERKRKLGEALVYHQTLTRAEFDEMRIPLERELAEAEDNLSQARLAETEVDAVLDFAEDLLLNVAGVWERCSLDQKQRLQQVLFPHGIEYADGVYRTQETSFLFKGLEQVKAEEDVVGSATGNRTRV
jgi:site-specific DNA recombinase